jgi:hypothetical protein
MEQIIVTQEQYDELEVGSRIELEDEDLVTVTSVEDGKVKAEDTEGVEYEVVSKEDIPADEMPEPEGDEDEKEGEEEKEKEKEEGVDECDQTPVSRLHAKLKQKIREQDEPAEDEPEKNPDDEDDETKKKPKEPEAEAEEEPVEVKLTITPEEFEGVEVGDELEDEEGRTYTVTGWDDEKQKVFATDEDEKEVTFDVAEEEPEGEEGEVKEDVAPVSSAQFDKLKDGDVLMAKNDRIFIYNIDKGKKTAWGKNVHGRSYSIYVENNEVVAEERMDFSRKNR